MEAEDVRDTVVARGWREPERGGRKRVLLPEPLPVGLHPSKKKQRDMSTTQQVYRCPETRTFIDSLSTPWFSRGRTALREAGGNPSSLPVLYFTERQYSLYCLLPGTRDASCQVQYSLLSGHSTASFQVQYCLFRGSTYRKS